MTLLIGTVSNKHVVLTSDRRCTVEERGVVSHSDNFQKVFPAPGRPLAIVHHGENMFVSENGLTVPPSPCLATFIRENADIFDQPSIDSVTRFLVEPLEPTVVRTLTSRRKRLVRFWGAGLAKGRTRPEIHEVCWHKDGRREVKKHGNLVVRGDGGKKHLPPNVRDRLNGSYNLDEIPKASIERATSYHDKLFDIVLQKGPGARRFSKERDQLSINKDGCQWITPPAIQETKGERR
jgi:hypothetical protein